MVRLQDELFKRNNNFNNIPVLKGALQGVLYGLRNHLPLLSTFMLLPYAGLPHNLRRRKTLNPKPQARKP